MRDEIASRMMGLAIALIKSIPGSATAEAVAAAATAADEADRAEAAAAELAATLAEITLEEETIPDTVQAITFDADGNVSAITHTRDDVAIRTDVFAFGTDTITEVRTLSTGESLTIVTNTDTLQTVVTYAAAE